jgi:hypothetical protein
MFKSRRMMWVGRVARMVDKNAYRLLVRNPEEKTTLKALNLCGKLIIELNEWRCRMGLYGTHSSWSG